MQYARNQVFIGARNKKNDILEVPVQFRIDLLYKAIIFGSHLNANFLTDNLDLSVKPKNNIKDVLFMFPSHL